MTAGGPVPMASEESAHTRLRLPALRPIKLHQPPAVVVTDDLDMPLKQSNFESSVDRSPVANLVLAAAAAQVAGQAAAGISEDLKLNGVCATGGTSSNEQDSSHQDGCSDGNKSMSAATPSLLTVESSTDGQASSGITAGDAMLENDGQSYVQVRGRICCTEHRRRMSYGMFFTAFVASSWVGAAHLLRAMYVDYAQATAANSRLNSNASLHPSTEEPGMVASSVVHPVYNAPFFTTWFCTTFNFLFYPVYLCSRLCAPSSEKTSFKKELTDSVQPYHDKGFTVPQFICRCGMFTLLWVITNFMFVHSLRLLNATDVIALYSTNVSFIYLLSWVVLEEQFVGIRIVAVIACNTGIALLAYMDGVSRSATLGGVVLAASAAAGSAVYKVLFKKFVGEVNFGQISFFFTLVGFFNVLLMWPFFLALYFSNFETIQWDHLPWLPLVGSALFIFLANILGNFGVMWTYETFLTLGLLFAIPASSVVDVYLYSVAFAGMKLAGIILTMLGFILVLLPDNWPDYLTFVLRWRRNKYAKDSQTNQQQDLRTSYRSRLRTQSGRVK